MEEFRSPCCVAKNIHGGAAKTVQYLGPGYHFYSAVWEAVIGEKLASQREHNNARDRYAVAVRRNQVSIGRSCFSSCTCSQSACSPEQSLSKSLYNSFSSYLPGFARTGVAVIWYPL